MWHVPNLDFSLCDIAKKSRRKGTLNFFNPLWLVLLV